MSFQLPPPAVPVPVYHEQRYCIYCRVPIINHGDQCKCDITTSGNQQTTFWHHGCVEPWLLAIQAQGILIEYD
jgi:hypothetical protein